MKKPPELNTVNRHQMLHEEDYRNVTSNKGETTNNALLIVPNADKVHETKIAIV